MKLLLLVVSLAAVSLASPMDDWRQFKVKYHKDYVNGDDESHRMNVFLKNKKMIDVHNTKFEKGQVTFSMKMNHLGDLEAHEVKARYNGFKRSGTPTNGKMYVKPEGVKEPASKDWREEGAVTPVKDQGQCGSCWAFSTTGSLEGQLFLKKGKLVSLSEQNLVDCSGDYGNEGCNGGLMDNAFSYIKNNGGIDTERSYPYTAEDGECRFKASNVGGTDTGSVDIPSGDEDALKSAVGTVGPVSVAIDAGNESFQFYSNGIYVESECSSYNLDHGVLAVGYGSENGQDYWLVKNSWNTVWGDNGYIKMARNQNNMCGIATTASYPTV